MQTRQLQTLLNDIDARRIGPSNNPLVSGLTFDSRKVSPGDVFFAMRGTKVDGHAFLPQAIAKGAQVLIVETLPEKLDEQCIYVQVADTAKVLGQMASRFYGNPSESLKVVGVTGTNGKTTTVTLLYDLFEKLGYPTGLISTIENRILGKRMPTQHTTPDALRIQALLAEMRDAGCEYVFMEVSSHAVVQERIAGLSFAGAVFTNISHEHLDYHKTFKAYIEAKKAFFDQLPETAFALTNIDDKRGKVMVQNTAASIHSYGLRNWADFRVKIVENNLTGLVLDMGGQELYSQLVGDFNAYNLLAVYAVARLLGQDELEVLQKLSELRAAEGRFDYYLDPDTGILGIVDYAHTPDALEKVLQTISRLKEGGKVYTVVGCGGDRDANKRPIMAKTACQYSDQVILTSDNPRTEDPEAILDDMQKGVPPTDVKKVLRNSNRRAAIQMACRMATRGDIVLVAGKGHEKYQEIQGQQHPFDDKAIIQEYLEQLKTTI